MNTVAETENTETVTATLKKWEAGADLGPRMLKQFNDAGSKARWAAQGYSRITGIIGKPETQHGHGSVIVSIGGTQKYNPEYTPGLIALQEKHGHVVTKANYKELVDGLHALERLMHDNPMIVDERITQEEHDAKEARFRQIEEDRKRKEAAERSAEDEHLAKLRAQYPWAKQDGSSHARLAANLKRLLSEAFPGVAFSCRSETASMMTAVRVGWKDGPTIKQVEEITRHAAYGSFDGMTDSYNYAKDAEGEAWRKHFGSAKYVTEDRDISEARAVVLDALKAETKQIENFAEDGYGHNSYEAIVGRMLTHTAFPAGAVVLGVEQAVTDEQHEDPRCERGYLVKFEAGEVPEVQEGGSSAEIAGEGITIKQNEAKDGVEIHFDRKPDAATIEEVKRNGFRWSRFGTCWYAKRSPYKLKFAYGLVGQEPPTAGTNESTIIRDPGEDAADRWAESQVGLACNA